MGFNSINRNIKMFNGCVEQLWRPTVKLCMRLPYYLFHCSFLLLITPGALFIKSVEVFCFFFIFLQTSWGKCSSNLKNC